MPETVQLTTPRVPVHNRGRGQVVPLCRSARSPIGLARPVADTTCPSCLMVGAAHAVAHVVLAVGRGFGKNDAVDRVVAAARRAGVEVTHV